MSVAVTYPLLNPNEPEAMLAAIHVSAGQRVSAGDLLFTLETTKSTEEVMAEAGGFVAGMQAVPGQTVNAGELFCYLAEVPDWQPPVEELGPAKGLTPVRCPSAGMASPFVKIPVIIPGGEKDQPTEEELSPAKGLPPVRGSAPGKAFTATQASGRGQPTIPDKDSLPAGLRITRPALVLAQQAGLDLSKLPTGSLVTEQVVKDSIGNKGLSSTIAAASPPGSRLSQLLIYGGGGHGKALIDMLRSLGTYHLAGIVDDGFPVGTDVMGLPVLGGKDALADLYAQGIRLAVNAVGGIGSVMTRIYVFNILAQAGFACPAVVHPTAWVEPSASLEAGVQVFPHAYVGSEAQVGFGTIINTGAIVSHECVLGDYVNISPGAMLAGKVQVGNGALIGMGVTVNLQVQIGVGARVGNSATVKADVPPNGIVKAGAVYP